MADKFTISWIPRGSCSEADTTHSCLEFTLAEAEEECEMLNREAPEFYHYPMLLGWG